jgi:hypothetical protein
VVVVASIPATTPRRTILAGSAPVRAHPFEDAVDYVVTPDRQVEVKALGARVDPGVGAPRPVQMQPAPLRPVAEVDRRGW